MRFVGVIVFLLGAALTVRALRGATSESRPRDVAWALVGPVAVVIALLGAVLLFVPRFLG